MQRIADGAKLQNDTDAGLIALWRRAAWTDAHMSGFRLDGSLDGLQRWKEDAGWEPGRVGQASEISWPHQSHRRAPCGRPSPTLDSSYHPACLLRNIS